MTKKPGKRSSGRPRPPRRDPNRYPKGWNLKRVRAVIAHYDNQSDEDAIAEAEASYKDGAFAMIQVPIQLVPKVQKLLAKRAG